MAGSAALFKSTGLRPLVLGGFAGILCAWLIAWSSQAADQISSAAPPDFSGFWQHGATVQFTPVPGQPSPVQDIKGPPDKILHPLFQGDSTNPILKPWAAAQVKKHTDITATGEDPPTAQMSCMPSGVPDVLTLPSLVQFLQRPDQVTILYQRDHQMRRIQLGQNHSAHPAPSWYGESVGHYEGDTLVVDTIGMNDKSWVDFFATPHTEALHVVERYHLINDGKNLQVQIAVDDPDTFTTPWSGTMTYARARGVWEEENCAENNRAIGKTFPTGEYPFPVAQKADF